MTLYDDISSACAGAVNALATTGWSWAVSPFSSWTSINVLPTGLRRDIPAEDRDSVRYEARIIRVATDGVASLPTVGDRFKDGDDQQWAVVEIESDGPGVRRYRAEFAEPETLGPQRGAYR